MSRSLGLRVSDEQYIEFIQEAVSMKLSVSDLLSLKLFGKQPAPVSPEVPVQKVVKVKSKVTKHIKFKDKPMTFVKEYKTKLDLEKEGFTYGVSHYFLEQVKKGQSRETKKGYVVKNDGRGKIKLYKLD